jgi:hypothetical protein
VFVAEGLHPFVGGSGGSNLCLVVRFVTLRDCIDARRGCDFSEVRYVIHSDSGDIVVEICISSDFSVCNFLDGVFCPYPKGSEVHLNLDDSFIFYHRGRGVE